jgi:glycerate 2-kinase
LGARLLAADGSELGRGGTALAELARIDLSRLDMRLRRVRIEAAVNWHNVLLGERGVTRIYGPQKGATPEQVVHLEGALETFAACVAKTTGIDIRSAPGTGASGGLGASVLAIGGALRNRYDLLMPYTGFDDLLKEADLILTAEGTLDGQTVFGKVPGEVGRRAKACGVPVIVLVAAIAQGAESVLEHGIDAYASVGSGPVGLEETFRSAENLLTQSAAAAIRMVEVGMRINGKMCVTSSRTSA